MTHAGFVTVIIGLAISVILIVIGRFFNGTSYEGSAVLRISAPSRSILSSNRRTVTCRDLMPEAVAAYAVKFEEPEPTGQQLLTAIKIAAGLDPQVESPDVLMAQARGRFSSATAQNPFSKCSRSDKAPNSISRA